jgi:hypothetical protein
MSQINDKTIFQVAPFPHRFIRPARKAAESGSGFVMGARCCRNGLNLARHTAKPGAALTFGLVMSPGKAARLLLDDTKKAAP